MQEISLYQIDAFASHVFGGNPAAVCPLITWLDDSVMQSIAAENNVAETAFIVPGGEGGADYALRWFTPTIEVDLCGHATLAFAYVVFNELQPELSEVSFSTLSGILRVSREGEVLTLDFPSRPPVPVQMPDGFEDTLGLTPIDFLRVSETSGKNVSVVASPEEVRDFVPDFAYIADMPGDGLIVTAASTDGACDFVSRYFAPHAGIPEDPVTGSAHCVSVPYWAGKLGKTKLQARQISARGGELDCELVGERVRMGGRGVLYLSGTIVI